MLRVSPVRVIVPGASPLPSPVLGAELQLAALGWLAISVSGIGLHGGGGGEKVTARAQPCGSSAIERDFYWTTQRTRAYAPRPCCRLRVGAHTRSFSRGKQTETLDWLSLTLGTSCRHVPPPPLQFTSFTRLPAPVAGVIHKGARGLVAA